MRLLYEHMAKENNKTAAAAVSATTTTTTAAAATTTTTTTPSPCQCPPPSDLGLAKRLARKYKVNPSAWGYVKMTQDSLFFSFCLKVTRRIRQPATSK